MNKSLTGRRTVAPITFTAGGATRGRAVFGPFSDGDYIQSLRLYGCLHVSGADLTTATTASIGIFAFSARPLDTAAAFAQGRPLIHDPSGRIVVAIEARNPVDANGMASYAVDYTVDHVFPVDFLSCPDERYIGIEVFEVEEVYTITGFVSAFPMRLPNNANRKDIHPAD